MEKSTSCKPLIYSLKNESTKNEIDSDKSFLFHLQEKCLNNGNFANKDNMNLWIVDYGASTHMNCHNRMTDITPIVPCFIHMLNGSSTVAKFEGSVVLSPSLVLTHDLPLLWARFLLFLLLALPLLGRKGILYESSSDPLSSSSDTIELRRIVQSGRTPPISTSLSSSSSDICFYPIA
ncbi:hypothetical protein M9H77_12128 [Catharanthus roseus]|uniref:Uncharacterized protein n=1 Tax=Catharanthus roseus TaxID=4058 RepID=A0ACC0BGF9_CATRO|nr:hypothetical protein M9H77_12128 [Catharanthus roseus]